MPTFRLQSYAFVMLLLPLPALCGAQSPPAAKPSSWRVRTTLSTKAEYDNNVYLASSRGRTAIDASGATTSGRYAGMPSSSDVITTVRAGVELAGDGMGGRKLSVTPRAAYEFYAQNAARRNVQLDLSVAQELGHGSELRLRGALTPSAFFKNYMFDAVDSNGDGSIAASERQYAAADFRELEAGADYRRRLDKSTSKSPVGATVRVGAGYYARDYESRFAGRNLRGPTAAADFVVSTGKDTRFTLGYDIGKLSATATPTVVLLDEPVYGRDFNGNGRATDLNARSVQPVDRSRLEQQASLKAQTRVGTRTELDVGYARRWRSFSSTQQFDVSNNGRSDARNEFAGELQLRLSKPLALTVGAQTSGQRLNRPLDSGVSGEVDDYSRLRGIAGLTYKF